MNGKANPLLVALLALVVGVPCAFADDDIAPEAKVADAAAPDNMKNPCVPKPLPPASSEHSVDPAAKLLPEAPDPTWFKDDPCYRKPYDSAAELEIYSGKHAIERPRPPIEWGLRLYDRGAYAPRATWLGAKNPIGFHFLTFGDFRVAAAYNDNGKVVGGKTEQSQVAARLNLDMDAQFTATERIHMFVRPIDKNGSFSRYLISGQTKDKFVHDLDFNIDTLFFEGDAATMAQGFTGNTNPYDRPFAIGRVPIVTQNGVWIEDAIDGAAFSITAKNNPTYDISNMDMTFFVGLNKVTTAADPGDKARVIGMAGFADLLRGYLEYGVGYLDAEVNGHSYVNATAAFSKRYRGRLANSVRLIGNFGQKGVAGAKTADGALLLIENSLVPRRHFGFDVSAFNPLNFVPYFNFFAGFRSPQSLARGGDSGGVLRNTGLAFETDGMTGYPTLDATAHDSYGGAVGVEYLFGLDRQIVIETAVVQRRGDSPLPGSEHSISLRYQRPFTPRWILRMDVMKGWLQGQNDIAGARVELRCKF
ncbi:MAG TPA: hypothetical protein VHX14_06365 [Thermoanaerobaculia bacterium]|jgi:hypothetical protein|nr:hypothetical protein [Thermoanaerobaculia bacterium]